MKSMQKGGKHFHIFNKGLGLDGIGICTLSSCGKWESSRGFSRSGDFSRRPISAFSAAQNSRPALILRRPSAAQTSSPAGFFRAGYPQKPHSPAKSPSCSLQPRSVSPEKRMWLGLPAPGLLNHSPSPIGWGKGWKCFRGGRRVNYWTVDSRAYEHQRSFSAKPRGSYKRICVRLEREE